MDHWHKQLNQDDFTRPRMAACRMFVSCLLIWIACSSYSASSPVPAQTGVSLNASTPTVESVGLRLTWGSPQLSDFSVEWHPSDSKVEPIRQLGINAEDSGSWRPSPDTPLRLNDSNTFFGGGDFLWNSKPQSTLKLIVQSQRVQDREKSSPTIKEIEWNWASLLDSLQSGPIELSLHDGATLRMDRIPGDTLRVRSDRTSWVFRAGEPLELSVIPTALPWRDQMGKFEAKLVRAGSDEVLWETEQSVPLNGLGSGDPIAIRTVAPDLTGVLELRCSLEPKRFLSNWPHSKSKVQRVVQFVTFDDKPEDASVSKKSSQPAWDWRGHSFWQTSTSRPIQHSDARRNQATDRWRATKKWFSKGDANRLDPFLVPPNESIRIPLQVADSRTPLIVHVGIEGWWQQAHIRVWESTDHSDVRAGGGNARSGTMRLLIERPWRPRIDELGRMLESSQVTEEAESLRSIAFLPSQKVVVVEIANRSLTESIRIGNMWAQSGWVDPIHANTALDGSMGRADSRLVTEYLTVDDWRTLLDLGKNITGEASDSWESMDIALRTWFASAKNRGVGQVSIPVLSKGSSLYPTRKLISKPWLQTGLFSDKGNDPIDKDVVRYLYRLGQEFDIAILPSFELNFPLGEFLHFAREDMESLLFVAGNGNPVTARRNPLSPATARCLQEFWLEFENMYRDEPGYAGYAVWIDTESHLTIPRQWQLLADPILDLFASGTPGNVPRTRAERMKVFETIHEKTFEAWQFQQVITTIEGLGRDLQRIFVPNTFAAGGIKPKRIEIVPIEPGNDLAGRDMLVDWWMIGPTNKTFRVPAFGNLDRHYLLGHPQVPPLPWFASANVVPRVQGQPAMERIKIWQRSDAKNQVREAFIINATPWDCQLEFSWTVPPSDLQRIPIDRYPSGEGSSSMAPDALTSCPYSASLLRWTGDGASIQQWRVNQEGTIERVDQMLRSMDQSVTNLSSAHTATGLLENEDFELPPKSKGNEIASGWAASMNPKAPVAWSDRAGFGAGAGLQIRFQSPGEIAWLQSTTFESDRNRLRLQLHVAEAQGKIEQGSATLLLWNPNAARFETGPTKPIQPRSDFSDGKWREWVADFTSELSAKWSDNTPRIYKLQLDLSGQGEIAIDSVRVSSDFLIESERADLRNRAFAAKRAWVDGNGDPAIRLLEGTWARLLRLHPAALALQFPEKITQAAKQNTSPKSGSRPSDAPLPSKAAARRWRIFDRQ